MVFAPTANPRYALAAALALVIDVEAEQVVQMLMTEPGQVISLLRDALRARYGERAARVILVIDQLEELFTLCVDDSQRNDFVEMLSQLTTPANGQPPVGAAVCGLRSDFYTPCADYPVLRGALQHSQVFIGAMSTDDLRAAILLPARDVGLTFEDGLVELLLADLSNTAERGAGYEAGRLPLLAHALWMTWQQRHGNELTVAAYQNTGRIRGAVQSFADQVFNGLNPAEQQAARILFLRLVNIGDAPDGIEDTRRRVSRADLFQGIGNPDAMEEALNAFTEARLLIRQDPDTIEITHEALLRAWPLLHRWIDDDRDENLLRQQLEAAATNWNEDGRKDTALLWRGIRLDNARTWVTAHPGEPSGTGLAFLAASTRHQRRAARLRLGVIASLVTLTLIASSLAGFAFRQRNAARAARDLAIFRELGAEAGALRTTNTSLAAQLDLTAYRLRPSGSSNQQSKEDLYTHLIVDASTPLATPFNVSTSSVRSVAFSPDGRILATASGDQGVRVWNVADRARPVPLSPALTEVGSVISLAFSPDGHTLAAAGNGAAQLWSLVDPAHPTPLGRLTGHANQVADVTFSPDGHTLASAGDDATVRLWNVADPVHPVPSAPPLTGHNGAVFAVAFSPDGHTLASVGNDRTMRLWNVADPANPVSLAPPPIGHTGPALSVAFSPDGHTLASGSQDRTVRLWNVADPAHPALLGQLTGHTSFVWALAFSPDGHTLASGSHDHRVLLWNVADSDHPKALGRALTGHTEPVVSVAFTPDGGTLATGSHDGTVRLWSMPLTILIGHTGGVSAVALGNNGRILATGSDDRTVRLWNVADPAHPVPLGQALTGFTGTVGSLAFSPDGRTLATGSEDDLVRLWNVADPAHPALLGQRTGHTGYVLSVAFSPDGRMLASGGDESTVRLWNVTDPAQASLVSVLDRHTGPVGSLAFSPDGRTLATGSGDRTVQLWDLGDLPPQPLGASFNDHTAPVWAVAFSPDGRTLASAGEDETVRLWDISTRPKSLVALGPPLTGHTNTIFSLAFSPDGRTLASASQDATIRLWNVSDSRKPTGLGQPLTGGTNSIWSIAFSPDGRTLVSGSVDGTLRLWNMGVDGNIRWICRTTANNLTPQEWQKYIPELPYNPPCH